MSERATRSQATGFVFFFADVRFNIDRRHLSGNRDREVFAGLFQKRRQSVDLSHRALVCFRGAFGFLDDGVDQQGHRLGDAVENEQFAGDQEIERGRVQVVARRTRHDGLDIVDKFVTDEANRPASEAR